MKSIKRVSKLAIVATVAAVLIAAVGAYAYWSAQEQVNGNTIGSGHLGISLKDGNGQAAAVLTVAGLMPGQGTNDGTRGGPTTYEVISTAGNPLTDLIFTVSNVQSTKSLKDNVKVAFLLCTGPNGGYWLTPSGTPAFVNGQDGGNNWQPFAYNISEYSGKSYKGLDGYTGITAGDHRHIKVFYYLPLNCAPDCHDDSLSFDMAFELEQNHG